MICGRSLSPLPDKLTMTICSFGREGAIETKCARACEDSNAGIIPSFLVSRKKLVTPLHRWLMYKRLVLTHAFRHDLAQLKDNLIQRKWSEFVILVHRHLEEDTNKIRGILQVALLQNVLHVFLKKCPVLPFHSN